MFSHFAIRISHNKTYSTHWFIFLHKKHFLLNILFFYTQIYPNNRLLLKKSFPYIFLRTYAVRLQRK